MRKIYYLLLVPFICLGCNVASAQSKLWDSAKSTEGISLRGEVGLNLSHFTHVERWNGIKPGLNVGVVAEKPILNSLSVKAGVFYTMKGTIGKNDGGFGGTLTTTFSPGYLEIPVMVGYRYQYAGNIRLQFDFGPYFAIGLHGKDVKKYSGNGSYTLPTKTEHDMFPGWFKRFDFGFRFGPEIVFGNKLGVNLEYEVSAINISKSGGKIGNGNFMVNVSYAFLTF